MKLSNHAFFRSPGAGLLLALTLLNPGLFATEPAKAAEKAGEQAADKAAAKLGDYRTSNTELNKAEVKAALEQIDAELKHLDALADAAPTPEQQADARTRYVLLKQRRDALQQDFTRARYEAFKNDLQAEKDKVAAWAKETFSTGPAANSTAAATAATADATAAKIADYRAESTDVNKAEAKASLDRLDADLALLAAKIDAMTEPMHKAELKLRLGDLKNRRDELNSQFRKARYDVLAADVKDEWNKLVN